MIRIEEGKEACLSGTLEELINDLGNAIMGVRIALAGDFSEEVAADILRELLEAAIKQTPDNCTQIKTPVKKEN